MSNLLRELTGLFYDDLQSLGEIEPVETSDLPAAYQSLLAHHDHMTVTVEAWHNSMVDVKVLGEKRVDASYSRKILLVTQRDNQPVQLGIVRIDLARLPEIVRLEIESQA